MSQVFTRHRFLSCLGFVCSLSVAQCTTERPREHFVRGATEPAAGTTTANDAGPVKTDAGPNVTPSDPDTAAAIREACGEPPRNVEEFSQQRLRSASADCAVWHYCGFEAVTASLESAVNDYVSNPASAQLMAARAAWRNALRVWSRAELFQFGPAASSAVSASKDLYQGKGLRDRIYAWPVSTRCRVEEQILEQASDLDGAFISGRGLFALEYLLFYEADDTACAMEGRSAREWNALTREQISERKLAYAALLVKDLRLQIAELLAAWNPARGNFKPVFESASGYPSEQEAMNTLAWALVYIEREVKDWKLGIPAGYTPSAPVTGPETPFAHVDTDAIRANLQGFRALFQGCAADGSGLGFDDWLAAANHTELADDIVAAYGEAQAKLDMTPQLSDANADQVKAAYEALRKLTNLIKGDLFGAGSPLNLKLPANVEGDTD